MIKRRFITVLGYKIEIVSYDYGSFLYPEFNGNAEFKLNKIGFKQLTSYLRTIKWMDDVLLSYPSNYMTWS